MQQTTTPRPSTAPSAASTTQDVPTTRGELDALILKRSELQHQLRELTDRRGELQAQRERMSLQGGREHEARIQLIDSRSAQIELDMFRADEAIATALAKGVSSGSQIRGQASTTLPSDERILRAIRNETDDAIAGAVVATATVIVGGYLVFRGVRRLLLKKRPPAPALPDNTGRLEQLQQSMDVIAIEVERISEGQRFVARVLNEKLPALGAGESQPLSNKERNAVPARADDRR